MTRFFLRSGFRRFGLLLDPLEDLRARNVRADDLHLDVDDVAVELAGDARHAVAELRLLGRDQLVPFKIFFIYQTSQSSAKESYI